ncbi:MAG: hypothetical protein QXL33_07805 [Sulfolobaceae archaeon]
MESYQILGIIGSALLIIGVLLLLFIPHYWLLMPMGYMQMHMGYYMLQIHPTYYIIVSVVPIILGLVGSFISDKIAAGILLILASLSSLIILFGFYGISFVLLLVSGILALTRR